MLAILPKYYGSQIHSHKSGTRGSCCQSPSHTQGTLSFSCYSNLMIKSHYVFSHRKNFPTQVLGAGFSSFNEYDSVGSDTIFAAFVG